MQVSGPSAAQRLLAPEEVPPVLEQNMCGASPFLFTCDHYGRLLPHALGELGLASSELERHIAWDIGIAGVAEQVAQALDAHLVAQRYSRLVIDCNRPPGAPNAIPMISERNERGSLIVTTNLPFGEWTKVFPDPRLAKAVVDRITHKAHIIDTGTESWRFRHGLARRGKGHKA